MAVCETPLFNDSDKSIANMNHDGFSTEAGTDTSSDTSAFLLSNTTKKKMCSSPRGKGTRRSSRLSKGQDGDGGGEGEGDGSREGNADGDGDGTDYVHSCEHFLDESETDPHIDVTNVLMATEEKIFISQEKSKDRDRLEKQMLAVALVNSVVETKNIKAEVASKESELRTKPVIKQENKDLMSGRTPAKSNGAINTQTVDENARIKTGSSSFKVKTEIPCAKPLQAAALPKTKPSIVAVAATALTNKAKIVSLKSVAVQNMNVKLNANAKTTAPARVVTKPAGTSIVTTSKVATTVASVPTSAGSMCAKGASTRARTRAAARTKVMGLKAEYASVKQTPRVAPKPSLPVPNPILALGSPSKKMATAKARSITRRQIKSEGASTIATPATASSSNTTTLHKVKTARTKIATTVHATKLPDTISSSILKNTLSSIPIKQETMKTVSIKAKPIARNSTTHQEVHMSTALPARNRIFSIDLDPEGFDFDLSLTMGMGGTDYTENATELPPITSTSYAPQNGLSKIKKESDPNADTFRSRGMSFELFSFTTGLEASDLKSEALTGGRPRGDSIIFDPISFTDGGIHEENGLRKRNASPMFNGTDGIDLFNPNNSGFTDVPTIQPKIQPTNVKKRHPAMTVITTKSRNKIPNPVSSHPANFPIRKSSNGRQSKSSPHRGTSYQRSGQSSSKKHHLMMGTNANGKDDTLHMPQGSAAAAAAAASLSSQIMQNTMNGTISHTSCPMELLNKGGRIGIYLPEARKKRIAKFHSKRKNRIWRKRIKYDCRKKLADSRPRVKGRFVKSLEGED